MARRPTRPVESRRQPLLPWVPPMRSGSTPGDGGALSGFSTEEADRIASSDPFAARFLRPVVGAKEVRSGMETWCLWLPGTRGAGCLSNDADEVFMVSKAGTTTNPAVRLVRSAVRSGNAGSALDLELVLVPGSQFGAAHDQVVAMPCPAVEVLSAEEWTSQVLAGGPMLKSEFLAAMGKEFGLGQSAQYKMYNLLKAGDVVLEHGKFVFLADEQEA